MEPFIWRDFEADGNSHLPKKRSSFSMSKLQNLDVVYFGIQDADDHKKVFDKGKYNVISQASLVYEKPRYATKDTHFSGVKQHLDKKGMAPTNDQVHSLVE